MRQLIILFVLQGFAHFVPGLSLDDFRLLNLSDDQDTLRNALESVKRRRRQFEDGPVPPYYFDIPNKELSEIKRGEELSYYQTQKSGEINEPEDVSFDSSAMDKKIMWVAKEMEKNLKRATRDEMSIDVYNAPYRINDAKKRQDNYKTFDMGKMLPAMNNHIGSGYDRKWKRSESRLNDLRKRNLKKRRYFVPYSEDYSVENLDEPTDVLQLDTFPLSRDDEMAVEYLDTIINKVEGVKFPDDEDNLHDNRFDLERNEKNDEDKYYPVFQIEQDLIPRFQSSSSKDNYGVMTKPMPRKNKIRSDESSKPNKIRVPSYDFQNYYNDMAMPGKNKMEIEDLPNFNVKKRVPSDFELADLQEQHRLMAMSRKKKTNIADSLGLLEEEIVPSDLQDGLQDNYRSMVLSGLKNVGNDDFPELMKYTGLLLDTKTSKPQKYNHFRDMPKEEIMLYENPSDLKKSKDLKPVKDINDIYPLGMMSQKKRKTVEIPDKFMDDSLQNLQELGKRRTLQDIFDDQRRVFHVPGFYSSERNYEEGDFLDKENRLPFLSEEKRLALKKREEHFNGRNDNKEENMLGELKNILKDEEERNRVQKRQEETEKQILGNYKSRNNDTDDIETRSLSDEQNSSQDKSDEDLPGSNKGVDFEKWLRKEYIKTMAQALNTMKRKRSEDWVPIISHDLEDNFRRSVTEETDNIQNSKKTQTPKMFEENKQSDQQRTSKNMKESKEDESNGQKDEMNNIDNPDSEETFQFTLAENKIKDIEQSMLNDAIDMIQRNPAEGSRSDLTKAIHRIRAAKDLDEIRRALNHLESTLGQMEEQDISEESDPSTDNKSRRISSYFNILRENGETEEADDIQSADKRNEEDLSLNAALNESFYQSLLDSKTTSSDERNEDDQCPPLDLLTSGCSFLEDVFPTIPIDRSLERACSWLEICYKCGEAFGLSSDNCDVGFLKESATLCQDDVPCNTLARAMLVPLRQQRVFFKRVVPAICHKESCIEDFLLTA
ncbi:uncharacterized protein LOC106460437 isoform X2 [Limulus polyphemus]|uniref:Uncharacterized protein LOC106460437 isoform X2 n=1 Tax=Limulus polyphemus TaxID=6850 RepID=A0ABM1SGV3_LIMPO|nr:uncharacterized protein LOC106460437 isoform X2 [Limulus polyphemus]